MRIAFLLAATLVVSSYLFSQVHIREKVIISDKASVVANYQRADECPGVYLRQGGGVVIDPRWQGARVSRYNWEMQLGGSTVLDGDKDTIPTLIGSFRQWSYLVPAMHYTAIPESADIAYCLDPSSTFTVGPGYPGFLFYRVLGTTPLDQWDFAMTIELAADSALEALPPQRILDDPLLPWNPYVRDTTAVMILPYPGTYRIVITGSNASGRDDLVLRSPVNTTLLTEAQVHVEDTLIVGPFGAGTALELALVSRSSPLLNGQTLYPQVTQTSPSTWELRFEDWTDLDFDDLDIRVELDVGTAHHLALQTATDVIWYGDTVDVALMPVDSVERLSPVGKDIEYEYSIEMPDTIRKYGTLLLNGNPGYVFEHIVPEAAIGRRLQFAANGEEPDSTVELSFHLKATYVGEVFEAKVAPGGSPKLARPFNPLMKLGNGREANAAKNLMMRSLDDNQPQPGDVVLENDSKMDLDRDVILLGETRYYAAVKQKDPTDPEIKKDILVLYAVKGFDGSGKPLFRGQETKVQYATALRSGGRTATLYHEKKWPQWEPDTVRMMDLDEGLIRIIGRYWREGSEENKVNLWVHSTTKLELFGKRLIEVKKPAKLGKSNNSIGDFQGQPFDLDAVLVKFGGENGIPPQMIKGQIEKESQFTNVYRYEPFEDISIQKDKLSSQRFLKGTDGRDFPFVVTTDGMGGDFPANHTNIKPRDYERSPRRMGEFLETYFHRYVNRQDRLVLGKKEYTSQLTKQLRRFFQDFVEWGLSEGSAVDQAIDVMKAYFHFKEFGLDYDLWAQTRISTSYGLVQLLYATSVRSSFEETGDRYAAAGTIYMERTDAGLPPERLNEHEFLLPRYVDWTLQHLRRAMGNPIEMPPDNWQNGFEEKWWRAFQMHNPGKTGYGQDVVSRADRYSPSR